MTRLIFTLFSLLVLLSCNSPADKGLSTANIEDGFKDTIQSQDTVKETLSWINSFKKFRDAVYRKDKNEVKQFIDFPIMNYQNEIWYHVNLDESLLSEEIMPFKSSDFDKYYDRLFSEKFIKTILSIKSKDLFEKGSSESKALKIENTTYILYADLGTDRTFSLNLASEGIFYTDEGEEFPVEYSVIYEFKMLENGQIRFVQIRLAG